jgi:cell division protein FtsN
VETGETGVVPKEPVPAAKAGPAAKPAIAPSPGPARAAPAPKEQRYLVMVATYTTKKQAEDLQKRLRATHFKATIVTRKVKDKNRYQVQVGPLTGAKAAENAANRIKTQEKLMPKVVKLPPKNGGTNHVKRHSR